MYDPVDAFVTFFESWEQEGIGKDGLPLFREVVMIRKAKPPLLQIDAVATEEDFEQFPEPHKQFEKKRQARAQVEGYPLVLWPAVSPAELQMLAIRGIVTVEQLAALASRKADDVLPQIKELAIRAKRLVELQGKVGKYELIVTDLTQQRDALAEQLREANNTIAGLNSVMSHKAVA